MTQRFALCVLFFLLNYIKLFYFLNGLEIKGSYDVEGGRSDAPCRTCSILISR